MKILLIAALSLMGLSLSSSPSSASTATTPSTTCTAPVWTSTPSQQSWNTNEPHQKWWVNNDAWAGTHGPQTISECTHSSWFSQTDQTDNGGSVETYPDTEYDVGGRSTTGPGVNNTTPISGFTSITSSFSETNPTDGSWDAGYDLWLNNWGSETMIWNQVVGSQTFWSKCAEDGGTTCSLAQPPVAVKLGGVPYHFFAFGTPSQNPERVFVRDTPVSSGSVNILKAWKWEVAHGWASATDIPTQLEYGTEVCSTNGTETFAVNSLDFHLTR